MKKQKRGKRIINDMLKMARDRYKYREIGAKYGLTRQRICQILQEHRHTISVSSRCSVNEYPSINLGSSASTSSSLGEQRKRQKSQEN